ncbi:sigma-70 family RNA polymerase sigma factor [Candidatus Woesearchaeota archaeon]|nr:sigma-70 family RNA polymerase sigma factor [Candidatus Woesearchaeota archaeon]
MRRLRIDSIRDVLGDDDHTGLSPSESYDSDTSGACKPLEAYLHDISKHPLLSADEEYEVAVRYVRLHRAKDREKLILVNLRLVVSVARRYFKKYRCASMMDVISWGNDGLFHAVEKFDPHKGYKFSTYAIWWIRQSIIRGSMDDSRTIRVPVHLQEAYCKIKRAKDEYIKSSGQEPTIEYLVRVTKISEPNVMAALDAVRQITYLESSVGENLTLLDLTPTPEKQEPTDLHERVQEAISSLNDREQRVIRMRFGLDDGIPHTLQETGLVFGVTRERIRQIEARALRRLRHPSRSKKLEDYV